VSDDLPTTVVTTENTFVYPTPLLRLMPAITFGMRAAALAGIAVSAGALAFGLTGAFDDGGNTTCCGADITPTG
jgi:hypothetical protein